MTDENNDLPLEDAMDDAMDEMEEVTGEVVDEIDDLKSQAEEMLADVDLDAVVPVGDGVEALSDSDKLLAALSYPIPIIGIAMLFMEGYKDNSTLRFHAINSILLGVAVVIAMTILSATIILACIAPFVWFVTLWPAWQTFQGQTVELPVLTKLARDQGWI